MNKYIGTIIGILFKSDLLGVHSVFGVREMDFLYLRFLLYLWPTEILSFLFAFLTFGAKECVPNPVEKAFIGLGTEVVTSIGTPTSRIVAF